MFTLLIPLLITTSGSIYGWNAMYAASNVPEMEAAATARLEKIAAEKCTGGEADFVRGPEYSYYVESAHYVEHAYAYIQCRRTS